MANPRWAEASVPRSLPERVAQLYYTHGLFCATHPISVIILALSLVLLCCYPLLSLPLPGNVPQHFSELEQKNSTTTEIPRWLQSSSPACYIQQIVMKTAVTPWTSDLILTDAFRAPLAEVFRLLEVIQNYQEPNSSVGLSDLCIHVETTRSKSGKDILPEYNCLTLSPANLWQQDVHSYNSDSNLISTIYNFQSLQKGKISLAELLFGLNMKDTGIKRYPVRKRQRIIQFAVTIVFGQYHKLYLDGLKSTLSRLYPLHQLNNDSNSTDTPDNVIHIYYPGEFDYKEFVPLVIMYLMFFIYIYFSVCKIEIVRSKFGIAVSALLTVVASLSMSIGLCFFFGLELAGGGRGREIIPYLVVVVGLENILVLTKSVVYTPSHLDVKIRIAQGLSREGWSITKNLLTEVTILTAGLLTLVPAIQEFCIFAIVGLLSDFFLQMFFYITVLGLDIKQMDRSEPNQSFYHHRYSPLRNPTLPRSRSTPRLSFPTQPPKVPKRLRLVHFWARTRIVQRAFMLCMVIWIGGIVYSAGILEKLVPLNGGRFDETVISNEDFTTEAVTGRYKSPLAGEGGRRAAILEMEVKLMAAEEANKQRLKQSKDIDNLSRLKPGDYDPVHRISSHHWAAILSLYNTTFLPGGYITLLPAILLSSPVSPERAIALRNPLEKQMPQFQWHSLAAALDPLDLSDVEFSPAITSTKSTVQQSDMPLVPTSPMELFLTAVLCAVSVLVVSYTMLVLYRCICSRNYAEWRASWAGEKETKDTSTEVVLEAVPLILRGHEQQVECLSTDGSSIVSSCLGGELRVWDVVTGDPVTTIDRKQYFTSSRYQRTSLPSELGAFKPEPNLYSQVSPGDNLLLQNEDDTLYKELAGVSSSHAEPLLRSRTKLNHLIYNQPDLTSTICTSFSAQDAVYTSFPPDKNGFNYGQKINDIYEEFKKSQTKIIETERDCLCGEDVNCERRKRTSVSDEVKDNKDSDSVCIENSEYYVSPIWCIDCQENLIAVGCANGRLEIWEARTGKLKCLVGDGVNIGLGVTCIRIIGHHILAARLSGSLDFYILDWSNRNAHSYRRTHIRTGSAGSALDWTISDLSDEKLRCLRLSTARAHQQPITVLESEGGRVISGSQDHTLKVYALMDQSALFTLHGHCGPLTALFIDRVIPTMAGSGSQDGMLCVWDLQTGACMYSIQAHDGYIASLTYSASYVISLGSDERLCVWERFQGHLLNTIQVSQTYCSSMTMLTHNLLITSKQGSLVVWDVHTGEPVRIVKLGHSDNCVFVQHIVSLHDSVACDYGRQLRIIRFPLVQDKTD